MKIDRVNTIIYCRDWLACVVFYRDKLKFKVNYANEMLVEFKLTETACLSVFDESRAQSGNFNGDGMMISLMVVNLQDVYLEMANLGLNPTSICEVWNSELFSIFDPEGVRIEFWAKNLNL